MTPSATSEAEDVLKPSAEGVRANIWTGELSRAQAIRILNLATDKDDPFWEHLVSDFYDEAADTMPTIMDVLATLGVTEAEYRQASGADGDIAWPITRQSSAVRDGFEVTQEWVLRDNASLRRTGLDLAEAATHVIREFDGVHRLALAVSAWHKCIADEGARALKSSTPAHRETREDQSIVRGWMICFRDSVASHPTFYGITDDQILGVADRDHAIILETKDAALKVISEVGWTEADAIPVVALMSAPSIFPVTDEMIEAALAAWYPGEWPNDDCFARDERALKFAANCRSEMRAALEAALKLKGYTPPPISPDSGTVTEEMVRAAHEAFAERDPILETLTDDEIRYALESALRARKGGQT